MEPEQKESTVPDSETMMADVDVDVDGGGDHGNTFDNGESSSSVPAEENGSTKKQSDDDDSENGDGDCDCDCQGTEADDPSKTPTPTTPTTTRKMKTRSRHVEDDRIIKMVDQIRRKNWMGCIPVILTLAPTSNSSTSVPPPVHVLLNRHTFLHVGLEDAVRKLHEYAPPTFRFSPGGPVGGSGRRVVVEEPESTLDLDMNKDDEDDDNEKNDSPGRGRPNNTNRHTNIMTEEKDESSDSQAGTSQSKKNKKKLPYPKCWFEDEIRGIPLKWQYFAGVLFDSICVQQHQKGEKTDTSAIPWKIRLHFLSYPPTLLDIDDGSCSSNNDMNNHDDDGGTNSNDLLLTTVEQTFFNSLKQSLVLQHGHAKVALNLTKQSHQYIWNSICTSDYDTYRRVGNDIQVKHYLGIILDPPGKTNSNNKNVSALTKASSTAEISPSDDQNAMTDTSQPPTLSSTRTSTMTIPIRLSIDPKHPMIQKRCDYHYPPIDETQNPTLGSLFCDWAPQYFCRRESRETSKHHGREDGICEGLQDVVQVRDSMSVTWRVSGVTPPLSAPVIDLWATLSHPDQFLYIIIVER